MSDIHFECAKCGQPIDAPEDLASQLIECPTCKETINVPARSQREEASKPEAIPARARKQKIRPPKSMTVFAILNFVFGGFGLLWALVSLVASTNVSITGSSGLISVFLLLSAMLSIVVGVLAIISGFGLIKAASWGSGCSIAYVIVAIVGAFIFEMLTYQAAQALRQEAEMSSIYLNALPGGQDMGMLLISPLVGGLLRLAYPIVLLCFLQTSKWTEVFAANRNEPA